MKLTTILVPLDGSPLAETALWRAVELVPSDGTVVLLRAAEGRALPGADLVHAQVQAVREAEEYLASVADRVRAAGIANVEAQVWYGPPAWAIGEAAGVYRVDLIAMSTHGRSGLGRLLLGSVAESVLRKTSVPLLLLRPSPAGLEAPSAGAAHKEASYV